MIAGPILALESSTSIGSVAVGDANGVFAEVVRNVAGGHSSALLPAADEVLKSAGLRPRDLAAVVVGSGPGSFTGLRIAAATAKGMLRALQVPLFGYSGLLATAAAAWSAPGPVCALFDARRRDVFAACYRFGGRGVEVLLEPEALALEAVIERFREGEPPLFVGEGAELHREELVGELGARVGPAHLALPRASALVWLAATAPELGRVEDPTGWEPEYLRASGAERIAARAAGRPEP
ncbi:MAG TPA: tRNA (adenosine(37)-N6)-threonylcarbamoyltransferase complex dimerization subunit type 1 TsaB [Longimicrobiaceae bacterium]